MFCSCSFFVAVVVAAAAAVVVAVVAAVVAALYRRGARGRCNKNVFSRIAGRVKRVMSGPLLACSSQLVLLLLCCAV
mgnify:CR=1 FL=1